MGAGILKRFKRLVSGLSTLVRMRRKASPLEPMTSLEEQDWMKKFIEYEAELRKTGKSSRTCPKTPKGTV